MWTGSRLHKVPPLQLQQIMTPGPRSGTPVPTNSYTLPFRWPNYLIPTIPFLKHIPKLPFLQHPQQTSTAKSQSDDGDDGSTSDSSYDSAITSPRPDQDSDRSSIHSDASSVSSSSNSGDQNFDSAPVSPPPLIPQNYLYGSTSVLKCRRCQSDICYSESIISKGFNGRYGRAYLCNPIPTHTHTLGKPTTRQLVTGTHLVADISCSVCLNTLGWKYISASDPYQQYKVGKFILETKRVVRLAHWQSHQVQAKSIPLSLSTTLTSKPPTATGDSPETAGMNITTWDLDIDTGKRELLQAEEWGDVNSEDEDELEDMFLGKWTPRLAAKRRKIWEKEVNERRRGEEELGGGVDQVRH